MTSRVRKSTDSAQRRALQVIRQLCFQRAQLLEEVRQLRAAITIYKELARKGENSSAV